MQGVMTMTNLYTKGVELVDDIAKLNWKDGDARFRTWKQEISEYLPDTAAKRITAIETIYTINSDYYLGEALANLRAGNSYNNTYSGDIVQKINDHTLNVIITILNDELWKEEAQSPTKVDVQKLKLLNARQTNPKFENELAKIICGDNVVFPYKTGAQISEFFNNLGFDWQHDGYTRATWIESKLLTSHIDIIYKIITEGLFKKKYFIDSDKDIDVAKSEFKRFIKESSEREELIDISEVFGLNIKNELLFEKETKTSDTTFNQLVTTAKELFVSNQKKLALEKLWDAFERLKTLCPGDKKTSCGHILDTISNEIERDILEGEFIVLTTVGNNYQIRHHETGKKPINSELEINYLFFRMLSLIDFALDKINPTMPNVADDIL